MLRTTLRWLCRAFGTLIPILAGSISVLAGAEGDQLTTHAHSAQSQRAATPSTGTSGLDRFPSGYRARGDDARCRSSISAPLLGSVTATRGELVYRCLRFTFRAASAGAESVIGAIPAHRPRPSRKIVIGIGLCGQADRETRRLSIYGPADGAASFAR
jgi:hypothetical protein